MLLRGLTWLVLFQLIGTAINHLLLPVLPGPIIGLLLMLGFLIWRGEVGEPLSLAASSLLRYLPLLLVPPAVGVMVYARDIAADFWAIVGALVLSLVIAMGVRWRADAAPGQAPRAAGGRAMTVDWQGAWAAVIHHPLFGIGITLGAYQLVLAAFEKTRWIFLQPVLVSMLLVIGVLLTCGLTYTEYRKSTEIISILLGPATVALAVPLYLNLRRIRQLFWPIFTTLVIGGVVATGLCVLLGVVVRRRTQDADDHGAQVGHVADCHAGGRADWWCGGIGGGFCADHRGDWRDDRPGILVAPGGAQPRSARYGAGHDRPRRRYLGGVAGKRRVRRLRGVGHESDGRCHGGFPAVGGVGYV